MLHLVASDECNTSGIQAGEILIMVTTRFYLDCRECASDSPAPLKLVITKKGVRALIPLNISLHPTQWDARRQIVIGHPRKQQFNALITERKLAVDSILFRMGSSGELSGLRACEVKQRVLSELLPEDTPAASQLTFVAHFKVFVARHSPSTQRLYNATLARMRAYLANKVDKLTFEEMDVAWLRDFDEFLAKTSPARNARNIHFRNIRAVFNDAITEELITCYPFRKFKIKNTETRKRSLTVEQLRALFSLQLNPKDQRYLDFFKLSFLLLGINTVDLCEAAQAVNGRVEYERAKTHRLYSVKVEPEAEALISKYAGETRLVNFAEGCKSYRSFYKHMADSLREIGPTINVNGFSSYWARHTWATIAADLDIPDATISLALGHAGENRTTEIYIWRNRKKIDAANRRVLDWVFYGKR